MKLFKKIAIFKKITSKKSENGEILKNFGKIFLIFWLFSAVSADAAMSQITTMNDLKNVYQKIYDDTFSAPEIDIAVERVLEHPWAKKADLTLDDIKIEKDFNISTKYQNAKKRTKKEWTILSSMIFDTFADELELVRFENLLRRKNRLSGIFANDTDTDSPFDVIEDLNRIDEILFGMATTPEIFPANSDFVPKFAEPYPANSLAYRTEDFELTPEDWQDRRASGSGSGVVHSTEGPGGNCIAQKMADLLEPLLVLNAHSLVSGCDTKTTKDSSFLKSGGVGKNVHELYPTIIPIPTPPIEKVEWEIAADSARSGKFLEQFSGIKTKIMFDISCWAISAQDVPDGFSSLFSGIADRQKCEKNREDAFFDSLERWIFGAKFDAEIDHRARNEKMFTKFFGDFSSFFESIKKLRDEAFDKILGTLQQYN